MFQNSEIFIFFVTSLFPNKDPKLNIMYQAWQKDQNQYLMELWSEKLLSENTFSKYCSFDSHSDAINPKLGQKGPTLVFHVPTVIERWKSIIKGGLRGSISFWNYYLEIWKFWLPMVTSSTQNKVKKMQIDISCTMLLENWKS